MKAGVLLTAEGLSDAAEGAVVDFPGDEPIVTDGPYGDVHELLNGFWIIQTATNAEAIEWAKRAPLGPGSNVEVRRFNEWDDFTGHADKEYVQKERCWREELKNNSRPVSTFSWIMPPAEPQLPGGKSLSSHP